MEALATKTAGDLALQGSGWACAVILGIVVVFLFRELRAKDAAYTALTAKVSELAATSASAAGAVASALDRMTGTAETRSRAIDELTRDHGLLASDVRHGLNNVLQVLNTVVERLRDLPGRRS